MKKFDEYLINKEYQKAYSLLETSHLQKGSTKEIIEKSKQLSTQLRNDAYSLAYKKADKEALVIEEILKKVIKISGETLY